MTMNFQDFIVRIRSVLLIVGALATCGCNVIGPQAISGGRGVYAEVINRTADEEILNVIVRMRYNETFSMISVASITASLRFSAQVGTNIGVGSSDNYAGNLVPLSAGVAYEENPTISYVPLSGEDFMRRMLLPVPLGDWFLLTAPAKHSGHLLDLAVRRINGLRNPLLDQKSSPGFVRLLELYDLLRRAGVLDTVHHSETEKGYFWVFNNYENEHGDCVRELLDLLGIEMKFDGSTITLPIRVAYGNSIDTINVQLRPAYEVLRVFGAGIEIPSAHLESGIVEPVTWSLPEARRFITILSSEKGWWNSRPDDTSVAIRFHDRWFYIDATDNRSKRAFAWLQTFIGMRLADPGAVQQAPVITIPVN
jgi:hypothetical protein